MPLHKVILQPNSTETDNKQLSFQIRTNYRSQISYRKVIPVLYVSMKVLLIIVESEDFHFYTAKGVSANKIGRFDGVTVYLSKQLIEGEYFIGIEEKEISQFIRRRKLNKIIDKM